MSITTSLYIEINVFALLFLLFMFINYRKGDSGITSADHKLFNQLLAVTALIVIFDTGMWVVDGQSFPYCIEINYMITMVYYILNPVICMTWLFYCDYKLFGDLDALKKRVVIYSIPTIVNFVFVLITPFTNLLFYIDTNNVYHRSNLFFITTALCLLYFAHAFAISLCLRRTIRSRKNSDAYKCLVVFPLFPLAGIIIQNIYFGVSLIWISTVLALFFVFINVQNAQISTDYLTALFNRRYLETYLEREQKNQKRRDLLFLISIDVDSFKMINDAFGHSVGDMALCSVADILRNSCDTKKDFLSRPGGDEFVISGRRKSKAEIIAIIDLLHENIKNFNETSDACYTLSLSIGYSIFGEDGINDMDSFMSIADKRMYNEKIGKKSSIR